MVNTYFIQKPTKLNACAVGASQFPSVAVVMYLFNKISKIAIQLINYFEINIITIRLLDIVKNFCLICKLFVMTAQTLRLGKKTHLSPVS